MGETTLSEDGFTATPEMLTEKEECLSVALFDVDGTLLKSSATLFATWFLFKKGLIGIRHLVLGAWFAVLHGLGLTKYDKIYEIGLSVFNNMKVEDVNDLCRSCFELYTLPRFYVGALDEVARQRDLGRKIVLVSAGPRYLVQIIGVWLKAEACITAGPLVEDGRVTSNLDGAVCSGEGKVQRVREYLWRTGHVPKDCVFYGDSINDVPLLQLSGQAVVVNPDLRLRKIARQRQWKIFNFTATQGDLSEDVGQGPLSGDSKR